MGSKEWWWGGGGDKILTSTTSNGKRTILNWTRTFKVLSLANRNLKRLLQNFMRKHVDSYRAGRLQEVTAGEGGDFGGLQIKWTFPDLLFILNQFLQSNLTCMPINIYFLAGLSCHFILKPLCPSPFNNLCVLCLLCSQWCKAWVYWRLCGSGVSISLWDQGFYCSCWLPLTLQFSLLLYAKQMREFSFMIFK